MRKYIDLLTEDANQGSVPYTVILKEIKRIINFPHGQVCKHYIASNLLNMLEENGYPLTDELANAIVNAHDDDAIEILNKIC